MSSTDWLPALVLLEDYEGHWPSYEEALYSHFFLDFVQAQPSVHGLRIAHRKHPLTNGREYTFWHLISEGPNERDRIPSPRRCERIRWPRSLVDAEGSSKVRVWRNRRRTGEALVLALPDFSYKIVLMCRKGYFLLKTAYPVEFVNQRRDLEKECLAYEASAKS
jgi:hypothetical protein